MNLKSKLFASAVAFTMVLSLVAVPVSAQTTAELTAQINSLLAMIAQLQAQISGGTTTGSVSGPAVQFNSDLTVGSKGADVTALQQYLVSKGFLQMPAGVAYGYFGSVTKAAVVAWQTATGISPAAGYVGPISRARLNTMVGGTTTGGTTGGTTTGGSTGITTPGVEGTISVSESSSGIVSTVYEGDEMVSLLGIKVEAKTSDMVVQRIKLDMDSSGGDTKFYNKAFSKLYVTVDGNTLASVDLNSSTVVKDGDDYFITITGFNILVPKGSSKIIVIKADAMSAIDTTDLAYTYTLSLANQGVRAVDGAGIDQYAGTTSVSNSPDLSADLTDSAALKISLNNSSPKKSDVVCSAGSNENECDKVTVLVMDVKAEKDEVTVTDLRVQLDESTAGGATSPTLYIYDGSTELDNASVTTSVKNFANFSDLDLVVAKDTTKTLTVKVDFRDATGVRAGFTAAASSTDFTTENSAGDSVTESGSATGYEIGVLNAGLEISLLSKSITTAGAPQVGTSGSADISTSTMTAAFTFRVKAVGGDITLGTIASNSPFFASSTPTNGAKSFTVYRNGVADNTLGSAATSTSFTIPSTCTTSGTNSCVLSEGNSVDIPVTLVLQGRSTQTGAFTAGLYSVGVASLNWNATNSTFMAGENDWRTTDVSFP